LPHAGGVAAGAASRGVGEADEGEDVIDAGVWDFCGAGDDA